MSMVLCRGCTASPFMSCVAALNVHGMWRHINNVPLQYVLQRAPAVMQVASPHSAQHVLAHLLKTLRCLQPRMLCTQPPHHHLRPVCSPRQRPRHRRQPPPARCSSCTAGSRKWQSWHRRRRRRRPCRHSPQHLVAWWAVTRGAARTLWRASPNLQHGSGCVQCSVTLCVVLHRTPLPVSSSHQGRAASMLCAEHIAIPPILVV